MEDKETAIVQNAALSSSATSSNASNTTRRLSLKEAADNAGPIGPAITAFWRSKKARLALEEVATQRSVYDDPSLAEFFKPHADFENNHRFDPHERWTWGEELPLIRRLDWKVTLWACTFFRHERDLELSYGLSVLT